MRPGAFERNRWRAKEMRASVLAGRTISRDFSCPWRQPSHNPCGYSDACRQGTPSRFDQRTHCLTATHQTSVPEFR